MQFADKVTKLSFFKPSRILVITHQSIFNMDKAKIKRNMKIKEIKGVSKLTKGGKDSEICVHNTTTHDYHVRP